jgi:hypothetical protein
MAPIQSLPDASQWARGWISAATTPDSAPFFSAVRVGYPHAREVAAPRSRGSDPMDVAAWLCGPRLEQYAPAFRDNRPESRRGTDSQARGTPVLSR